MVMSAVSSVSTFGVLVTVMPRAWAAITSILSTPLPKLAISPQLAVGVLEILSRYLVGDGGHQHVGGPVRLGVLFRRHRRVVEIEPGVEQLAIRVSIVSGSLRVTTTRGFLLAGMSCSHEAVARRPFGRQRLAVEA